MNTKLEKILVPVDGSEAALRAARFANYLASVTGATLTLMHVQDNSALELLRVGNTYARADAGVASLSDEQFQDIARRFVADPYFEAAKTAIDYDELDVEIEHCFGKPSSEICAFAERERVDLIVMGSRGRSELKDLLLGSVSSQVVDHASCPVTIVR